MNETRGSLVHSGGAPLICFGLALLPVTLLGHHSFGPFDQDHPIELSGVVVDLVVRSPHSMLVIEAENEDGVTERWEIEMGPVPSMRRQGVGEDSLRPGDPVVVRGAPRRDGVRGVLLAKGLDLFRPDGTPVGHGGPEFVEEDEERPAGTEAAERFSGVWLLLRDPNNNRLGDSPLPLTEWAARFRESYQPTDSPAMRCVPPNLPAIFYAPYLYGVDLDDDRVVLHNEYFAVVRTIPLGAEPTQAEPSGLFGYATARLEDGSLVVETEQFPPQAAGLASIYDPNGRGGELPSSANKHFTERYTVTNGGRTLVLDYTVEDPEYLTAPFSSRVLLSRLPDDTPIQPFECDEESASRTILNIAPRE